MKTYPLRRGSSYRWYPTEADSKRDDIPYRLGEGVQLVYFDTDPNKVIIKGLYGVIMTVDKESIG